MGPVRRCLHDVPSKLDKAVGPKLDAKSKIHFVPSLPTPTATSCFDVEREGCIGTTVANFWEMKFATGASETLSSLRSRICNMYTLHILEYGLVHEEDCKEG